jgi:hypothetical protein
MQEGEAKLPLLFLTLYSPQNPATRETQRYSRIRCSSSNDFNNDLRVAIKLRMVLTSDRDR